MFWADRIKVFSGAANWRKFVEVIDGNWEEINFTEIVVEVVRNGGVWPNPDCLCAARPTANCVVQNVVLVGVQNHVVDELKVGVYFMLG